ncbi:hypothetical protein Halha_0491 [Halobacteroides halobius DSM 5150]|uniref:Uncharacterized protein n=1 Tax=Halobacteroides halobius (strain ATCC 35273 / DSM 5150 / MD-1) TaxID=748449 RepID=L0K623_HALHC|nr:hypothetical protein [Halobacteroides halobius]AGB40466.1 hypothetical protein Halha_0491 [Halobacteroides halobius DSM 5150]
MSKSKKGLINSLWEKLGLGNSQVVSFTSLNPKAFKQNKVEFSTDIKLNVNLITSSDDILNLPKCHQNLITSDINYNNFFLIYVSLNEAKRIGSEIKIEEIIIEDEEVIVEVLVYSATNQLSLGMINSPYDLVKINRSQLMLTDDLEFKFIDYQGQLITQLTL